MSRTLRRLCAVALILFAPSCLLDNPEVPELAGPSEVGHAIEVRAVPDQLVADGWSSSVIEAVLRGPNSERIANALVYFEIDGFVDLGNLAPLNGPRPTYGGVEATQVTATTDSDGVARARYWAPFRDEAADDVVTIFARESGTNFRTALRAAGRADIFLRAADRPVPSPIPIPQPGCPDPSAEIELSGLCPGGEILAGRTIQAQAGTSTPGTGHFLTRFIWNWGDGTSEVTGSSSASHVFSGSLAGFSMNIQVTVVNSCGASAAASESAEIVSGACP
jgi:hypothetical protein